MCIENSCNRLASDRLFYDDFGEMNSIIIPASYYFDLRAYNLESDFDFEVLET